MGWHGIGTETHRLEKDAENAKSNKRKNMKVLLYNIKQHLSIALLN